MSGRRRGVTWATTAWICTVAVVGVLVWAILSRAGEGLAGARDLTPSSPVVLPTPTRTPLDGRDRERPEDPRAGPSDRGTHSPDRRSPSVAPPPSAVDDPAPTASAGPTRAAPSPTPGNDGDAGPGPRRRSWHGEGGVVTTECRGARIRLVAAQPDSGYRVEVDDRGPDRVRVELERNDGERRVRVEAACSRGRPGYRVQTD